MFALCISMFCILTPLPATMEQNHRLPVRRPTSRASREDDYLRLALLIMQRGVLRSMKMMMVVVMMVLVVLVMMMMVVMVMVLDSGDGDSVSILNVKMIISGRRCLFCKQGCSIVCVHEDGDVDSG